MFATRALCRVVAIFTRLTSSLAGIVGTAEAPFEESIHGSIAECAGILDKAANPTPITQPHKRAADDLAIGTSSDEALSLKKQKSGKKMARRSCPFCRVRKDCYRKCWETHFKTSHSHLVNNTIENKHPCPYYDINMVCTILFEKKSALRYHIWTDHMLKEFDDNASPDYVRKTSDAPSPSHTSYPINALVNSYVAM